MQLYIIQLEHGDMRYRKGESLCTKLHWRKYCRKYLRISYHTGSMTPFLCSQGAPQRKICSPHSVNGQYLSGVGAFNAARVGNSGSTTAATRRRVRWYFCQYIVTCLAEAATKRPDRPVQLCKQSQCLLAISISIRIPLFTYFYIQVIKID